jgi:putative transcriptional regulator
MATVKVTPEMVAKALAETDWARVDAMTDEEIEANVAADPDAPPILSEEELTAAIATGRIRRNTPEDEARINSGIAADPDNPEWGDADFAEARPAAEIVPDGALTRRTPKG